MYMKKLLKIFFWILTALLSLLILASILTQTSIFKSWLSDKLAAVLSESLSANVVIGHIDGTLFTNLEIHDLIVTDQTDSIISISNISAGYALWPLIDKRIVIQNLTIEMPEILLNQNKNGEWNITSLFSGDSVTVVDSLNADSSTFDYSIVIEKFSLRRGLIVIQATEDLIPSEIRNINIDLAAEYRTDKFHLQLDSMGFKAKDPDLELEKLAFDFGINKESLELNNFELITGRNRISALGNFKNNDSQMGELQLAARDLDLTELHILLPDIMVGSKRDLEFSGKIVEDSISLGLNLKAGSQSLSVNIFSVNGASLFDSEQSGAVEFESRIEFNNIILENWLELDVPVQIAAGDIYIKGWIKNQDEHNLEITGHLTELKYKNYSPESFRLQAQFANGNVKSILQINSKNGRFNIQSEIDHLFNDPKIIAKAEIRNLNLQKALDTDGIDTDLNFDIQLEYSNLSNPDYYSYIDVNMFNSRYDEYFIDLFNTRLQFRDSLYILDSLSLHTSFAEVLLAGTGNFYGHNDLDYTIQIRDLEKLGPLLNIDSLRANGSITGALRGKFSSFTNHTQFDLNNVKFNTIDLDTMKGTAAILLENDKFMWDGVLTLAGISVKDQQIGQIQIKSVYEYDEISSEISFLYTPDIYGSFTVTVKPDSIISVDIPQIDFMFRKEQWSGYLKNMDFDQNIQNINIEKFHVHCINCEDSRSIDAHGMLSMNGYQNFSTRINDIDLNLLMQSLEIEQDFAGKIDLSLDLSGTMQAPIFAGKLSLEHGRARDLNFQELICAYEYGGDQLLLDLMLAINATDSLDYGRYFAFAYLPDRQFANY